MTRIRAAENPLPAGALRAVAVFARESLLLLVLAGGGLLLAVLLPGQVSAQRPPPEGFNKQDINPEDFLSPTISVSTSGTNWIVTVTGGECTHPNDPNNDSGWKWTIYWRKSSTESWVYTGYQVRWVRGTNTYTITASSPTDGENRYLMVACHFDNLAQSNIVLASNPRGMPPPTPLVGSITATSASVSWTAVTNATSYDMRYKKRTDATWTTSTGVTSPRSLSSLDPNTGYEVQLRTIRTSYPTGSWSSSTNFTTPKHPALSSPTPSVGSITADSASVSWTAVTNATSYDMRYKKRSLSGWTTATGVTSPRTLSNLDADTGYEVQLRSMATGYNTGAWSSSTNFDHDHGGLRYHHGDPEHQQLRGQQHRPRLARPVGPPVRHRLAMDPAV